MKIGKLLKNSKNSLIPFRAAIVRLQILMSWDFDKDKFLFGYL